MLSSSLYNILSLGTCAKPLGLTISEFTNQGKVTLFSARTSPVRERPPEKHFQYQRDVENYMDLVLDFLLFDKHACTHGFSLSIILVSIFMLQVYVTFSLFLKI